MGIGIREPTFDGEITGTFTMLESNHALHSPDDNNTLKTTSEGIVLSPQPHDNPNDPLNWPIWRRDLALIALGWHCFVGGGQTAILASDFTHLAEEFDVGLSKLSYLVGAYMLSLAVGSLLLSPTAILFGKRSVYLLGILIFLAGSIWAALAKSYGSLLGARILSGIGVAGVESMPSATIAEIYFAHERAYRLGLYTLLLLGGKNLVPMLAAFVFQWLNRQWLYWIISIIVGINFILHLLFVPETYWNRAPTPDKRSQEETVLAREARRKRMMRRLDTETSEIPNSFAMEDSDFMSITSSADNHEVHHPVAINHESGTPTPEKMSYFRSLKLYNGRHTQDKWWMVFLRPLLLLTHPHVLFSAVLYCFAVVWLILASEVVSPIFGGKYHFTKLQVGLIYISPFTGGVIGSLCAGKTSDYFVRYLASKNNGVYEPEFRLFMAIPAIIFSALGLMGFGWSAQNHDPWIAPVIFFGILGFGSSVASTTAITFGIDSYKMFAGEVLVTVNVMKNVMGFVFSLFNNSFATKSGDKTVFIVYGAAELFIGLCAIPLYIYGKKIRRFHDKLQIMRWLYVKRDHQAHH